MPFKPSAPPRNPQTVTAPRNMACRVLQGFFPGGFSRVTQVSRPAGTVQPKSGSALQLPSQLASFRPSATGTPLPDGVRHQMESFFGTSFSDVRVHVGVEAPAIGALAFTCGSDLYFAPGQYNPGTPHGQQLLGHELTHVVQQRAGRVRNPFGSGTAVVQDPTLEAEADRMGHRAALQPMPVQAKPTPAAPRPPGSLLASNASAGPGRQIRLASHGQEIGSVEILDTEGDAVRVVNLKVDPRHRQQGAGMQLMRAAASEGLRMGKTRVTLESQDNGSGRLTRWYERMGFAPRGRNKLGMVVLETSAISLQARLARESAPLEPARSQAPQVAQAAARTPRQPGCIQPMQTGLIRSFIGGRIPTFSATAVKNSKLERGTRNIAKIKSFSTLSMPAKNSRLEKLPRNIPKARRVSTFILSDTKDNDKLEQGTKNIAKNTKTTFMHQDHHGKEFKLKPHLSKEPLIIVAEQADLNKLVKVDKKGEVIPGIVAVIEKLKGQGFDVSLCPSITVVSCHSAHSIAKLAAKTGVKVTGFDGALKLDEDTGTIKIGTATNLEDFQEKSPKEQKKSVKTVKDGIYIEASPDDPVNEILKLNKWASAWWWLKLCSMSK